MVKHKKHKACTASVHKKGHFVEVKARCHVGKAKLTTASACKHMPRKTKHKSKHKLTQVPAACKGLRGKERKECAIKTCNLRPKEYREPCLEKAGIK